MASSTSTPHDHHQHENKSPYSQLSSSSSSVVVVMVPFPAQSHLNQLLQLALVVSSYDIPVHYVSSTLHNSRVKSRTTNPLPHLTKIHFHDLDDSQVLITHSPPPNPNPNSKTKLSEHRNPLIEATMRLRKPVAAILRSLSPTARRLVVVNDVVMASAVQDVVSLPNAEAYAFNSASAFSGFAYRCETMGRNHNLPIKELPSMESCFSSVLRKFVAYQVMMTSYSSGELFNSCRAIEGSFLDLLANDKSSFKRKMWAVGPLHQTTDFKELRDQDKCLLGWLDKQEPNSVLYISFGTTTTLSEEEIKELAIGLEQSGVKFIWVLRDADKADIIGNENGRRPQLPDGFEERMGGMGMVVREWVPQVQILGHPSTGGFMSHCGWNSCMESLSMGVPIAAWPMHSDQPMNAVLITEVLKVGVAVMEWEQRHEMVTSSMISRAARKLMASEEGDEIRKRVVEIGEAVKQSVAEGGDCRSEWDSFIAHITREGSSQIT
ncbi:UDP-glucuronosyl/UDP-glucosyltransferase [Trema orientale]|uniref:Glycosyltransferase n=1 Tax=Trema orientale TaxID=63057 RepID=A0A2P5E6L8_TREOI|nr:UDP-glucuronosyl/UDP-glucosyltransferase [Trema orientale]